MTFPVSLLFCLLFLPVFSCARGFFNCILKEPALLFLGFLCYYFVLDFFISAVYDFIPSACSGLIFGLFFISCCTRGYSFENVSLF